MQLIELIKSFTDEELADFAERCQTTPKYLTKVAREYGQAGESLAINIERESKGAVRCEDLRPDVDWAYIRSTTTTKPKKHRKAA